MVLLAIHLADAIAVAAGQADQMSQAGQPTDTLGWRKHIAKVAGLTSSSCLPGWLAKDQF